MSNFPPLLAGKWQKWCMNLNLTEYGTCLWPSPDLREMSDFKLYLNTNSLSQRRGFMVTLSGYLSNTSIVVLSWGSTELSQNKWSVWGGCILSLCSGRWRIVENTLIKSCRQGCKTSPLHCRCSEAMQEGSKRLASTSLRRGDLKSSLADRWQEGVLPDNY